MSLSSTLSVGDISPYRKRTHHSHNPPSSAAGLSGIAVLFGLCGASYHRMGTVFMALLAALATLCTLIVWVISMVLFGIARQHVRDHGGQAQYGNANWLGVGALAALLIGFCASFCGVFGHYRRHRHGYVY